MGWYGSNFCTPIGWSILVDAKIRRTSVVSQIFNFDQKNVLRGSQDAQRCGGFVASANGRRGGLRNPGPD